MPALGMSTPVAGTASSATNNDLVHQPDVELFGPPSMSTAKPSAQCRRRSVSGADRLLDLHAHLEKVSKFALRDPFEVVQLPRSRLVADACFSGNGVDVQWAKRRCTAARKDAVNERGRHQQCPSEYLRKSLLLDVGASKHVRFGIESCIVAAIKSPVTEFVRRGVPLDCVERSVVMRIPPVPLASTPPGAIAVGRGEPQPEADQTEHVHLARLIHAARQEPVSQNSAP